MEAIEVKKQHQLAFKDTFEFCLSSIRHRFTRSMLTLAVVILAVAFFMYLQCTNIFRNSVRDGVEQEIIISRKPGKLLGMIYTPYNRNEFAKLLVDSRKDVNDIARIAKVLEMTEEDAAKLAQAAYDELIYQNYFSSMPIGKRKELFGRLEGDAIFTFLLEDDNLPKTKEKMLEIGGMTFPGGNDKMTVFLEGYPAHNAELKTAYDKWLAFQKSMRDGAFDANDSAEIRRFILRSDAEGTLNDWASKVAAAGFVLSEAELDSILRYQRMTDKIEKIQLILSLPEYRQKWRRVYGQEKYRRMDEKLAILDTAKTMGILAEATYPDGSAITSADMKEIANEFRSRKKLRDLELYLDINLLKESGGFSPSQLYLMALSFLVCVVGITNAMLMSITERFREIATLKCLGATDSFILVQIVLEALIQGVIGSFAGIILGFFAALINSLLQVGFRVFTTFDFGMIGIAAVSSLAAGMLLAVLASLYPSAKAARMAPMEAMRVE